MRTVQAVTRAGGLVCVLLLSSAHAGAKTLSVGPAGTYGKPCQAFAAASDGDRIEIDASGSYSGDVCAISRSGLTIVGVGARRAAIDAAGKNALGKAIWVVQGDDTTIENIELSGASVPDKNGAGIRQEGKNLTVRGCSFHDNEDGILAGDSATSVITIESSEFDHNGAGDGYSHNLYINHVARLTFRYNYSHRAVVGHLLKTRAAENYILYNRLSGEADGSQSYEIDVPNGGTTYVIGNVVEQGAATQNPTMLAFLAEGANDLNPSHSLFVINNTFVNHLGRGTFVSVGSAATTEPVLQNNVFFGGGSVPAQASPASAHNYAGSTPCLVNADTLDVALLPNTPCVDGGLAPGADGTFSLAPTEEYVHPTGHAPRPNVGVVDIGAYEYSPHAGASSGGAASGGRPASSSGASAGGANGGTPPVMSGGALSFGGSQAGGASAADSSGGAPSLGGASSSSSTSSEGNGCGCRVHAPGQSRGAPLFALMIAMTVFRIRRRS